MEKCHYHVSTMDTKVYDNAIQIKLKGFCTQKRELYLGLLRYFHIYFEPNLGVKKVAAKTIPWESNTSLNLLGET